MPEMIQINFNRFFPVFTSVGVNLLPHASIPLHIFEPRYVQMVTDCLDSTGQIALATFDGPSWQEEYHGNPPIRPVVCLGQIEQHEKLPKGRYNILLLGVCRAQVLEEQMPDEERLYRSAKLAPLETNPEIHEPALVGWRERIREMLESETLSRLKLQPKVAEWFDSEDIPSHVLVEIVGHFLMTTSDDSERRYRLLSEPDALERADFTERELRRLQDAIERVEPQADDWPKGLSWN